MQQTTRTANCTANHAISATLKDGFKLALKAEGKAPKTLRSYLQAAEEGLKRLRIFKGERGRGWCS